MAFSTKPNSKSRRRRADKGGKQSAITKVVHREVIREMRSFVERKFIDTYLPNTITSTVQLFSSTVIPQGVAQSQRVGERIVIVEYEVEIIVNYGFASSLFAQDIFDNLRISHIRWKPSTILAVPSGNIVYENTPSFGVMSPFNVEGKPNFTVLEDFNPWVTGYYDSTAVGAVPTSKSLWKIRFRKKCNHPIIFSTASNTGAGHLYFLFFSDSTLAPHPSIQFMVRIWYTDE